MYVMPSRVSRGRQQPAQPVVRLARHVNLDSSLDSRIAIEFVAHKRPTNPNPVESTHCYDPKAREHPKANAMSKIDTRLHYSFKATVMTPWNGKGTRIFCEVSI